MSIGRRASVSTRWLSERDNAADDVEALPRLIGTPIGFREWAERNLAPVLR